MAGFGFQPSLEVIDICKTFGESVKWGVIKIRGLMAV